MTLHQRKLLFLWMAKGVDGADVEIVMEIPGECEGLMKDFWVRVW